MKGFEYPVTELTPLEVTQLRVRAAAIEELCTNSISHDTHHTGGLTDRAWLAQSVLNILEGKIDDQLLNPEDGD